MTGKVGTVRHNNLEAGRHHHCFDRESPSTVYGLMAIAPACICCRALLCRASLAASRLPCSAHRSARASQTCGRGSNQRYPTWPVCVCPARRQFSVVYTARRRMLTNWSCVIVSAGFQCPSSSLAGHRDYLSPPAIFSAQPRRLQPAGFCSLIDWMRGRDRTRFHNWPWLDLDHQFDRGL
jgi:hypothetical protein